ncbi:uncharacterized protein LOC133526494 [Cydia pomonella]|uniref:uncharacterized protein LOC133526494 n=1 Tax=Cydia pomonella TaxID=82600 RepID=UPI002ADD6FF8|nr:uncharacterized protein LOC133526494 [Cydia pomonella]
MHAGLMCLDRYCFRKYYMPIEFLVLIFYINSVSTSTRNFNTSNATNVFRTKEISKNFTNISEASSSDKIFRINKKQENDFDLSEIIAHFDEALQEKLQQNLDKEDKEFLRWLDIDPGPSDSLARLKRFRRQASNPRSLKRKASKSPRLQEKKIVNHLNFNKNLPSHSIPHKELKQGKKSARVPSPTRLEKIIPELRWMYDSSSLDPSLKRPKRTGSKHGSLKRLKRQADSAEFRELPRWPGMPTEMPGAGALRQAHNTSFVKRKIMSMMMQSLYSAQERLWPLGPIVAKYDSLTPYRMAFIFLKLDQLVHEGHSILMYLDRQYKNNDMTITKRLQLYAQLVRRNVDVTYLVDYIMERVPKDQVVRIRQWLIRHEQEKLMKDHVSYGKTTTKLLGRPLA